MTVTREIVLALQVLDPQARRYAAHMVGERADGVLLDAYVDASYGDWLSLPSDERLIQLLQLVQTRIETSAPRQPSELRSGAGVEFDAPDADALLEGALPGDAEPENVDGSPLSTLPVEQRSAMLLTILEGLSVSEAARVLREPSEVVAERLSTATRTFGAAIPDGAAADPVAMHRTLAGLPVASAGPLFWADVERSLPQNDPASDATLELPVSEQPQPSPSRLVVGALVGVIVGSAIAFLLVVNNGDGDQVAAGDGSSTVPTAAAPTTAPVTSSAPTETTPASTASTTSTSTSTPTSTSSSADQTSTSVSDSQATTSTEATTTSTSQPGGLIQRGQIPFPDDRSTAQVNGSLTAGQTDSWKFTTDGATHIAVLIPTTEGPSLELAITGPDGLPVDLASDDVFFLYRSALAGEHVLELAALGEQQDQTSYDLALAVSPFGSGVVRVEDETDSQVHGLADIVCDRSGSETVASGSYESDDEQSIEVRVDETAGTGSVTWSGSGSDSVAATATVASVVSLDGGFIVSATFTDGPSDLLDLPVALGLHGCPLGD